MGFKTSEDTKPLVFRGMKKVKKSLAIGPCIYILSSTTQKYLREIKQ